MILFIFRTANLLHSPRSFRRRQKAWPLFCGDNINRISNARRATNLVRRVLPKPHKTCFVRNRDWQGRSRLSDAIPNRFWLISQAQEQGPVPFLPLRSAAPASPTRALSFCRRYSCCRRCLPPQSDDTHGLPVLRHQ